MKKIMTVILIFFSVQVFSSPQLTNLYPDDPTFTACVQRYNQAPYMGKQSSSPPFEDVYTDGFWTNAIVTGNYILHYFNGVFDERFGRGIPFLDLYCVHDLRLDVLKTNSDTPFQNNTCNELTARGSIIDFDKKIITEQINIVGTELKLTYSSLYDINSRSNKVIEQEYTQLKNIQTSNRVRILAGQSSPVEVFNSELLPSSGLLKFKYLWDPQATENSISLFTLKSAFQINLDYAYKFKDIASAVYDPQTNEIIGYQYVEKTGWLPKNTVTQFHTIYNPQIWGLSGWTISAQHYFDKESKKLFLGTGFAVSYLEYKTISDPLYGTIDILVDKNSDSIIYKFDQQGRHLETYNNDLKYVVLKFEYENNKIKRIKDRFDKSTEFLYNSSGQVNKIISPYGIETYLTIEDNQIIEVASQNQKKYQMTYNDRKILNTFKNIDGVVTTFLYNEYDEITGEQRQVI